MMKTTMKLWGMKRCLSVLLMVAPLLLSGLAFAQEEGQQQPERKTKRTQAMNNKTYTKLQEAQELVEAKNLNGALRVLRNLENGKRALNDAEKANVYNMYAFIYYSREDYRNALASYEKILRLPQASEGVVVQARYSVAQLYFVTEQWSKGVRALREWFKVTKAPTASAYVLMAQGLYQTRDYNGSLKNLETAIRMYREKGKIPKENWYSLQRFLYYEKKNYRKVVTILKQLLTHYPKKAYWLQLAGMYAELDDEGRQLAAYETAYRQNMLTKENELTNMAYLFLGSDVPYKAAKILDKSIESGAVKANAKHLEVLGSAWRQSQELKKAIPVMVQAARKSDKGEIWARLCGVYVDNDQFKNAVDACANGLKKGGVKRPDTAYLLKGTAHFNLKQYKSARAAFNQAKRDKRTKKFAEQWIKYMDKELERQKSLEQV